MEAISSQNPPFKLILGGDAWEVYKQREQEQNAEYSRFYPFFYGFYQYIPGFLILGV